MKKISKRRQKLLDRIQEETGNRIEALLIADETTINVDLKRDLAGRINRLNLYYEERYGNPYHPKSKRYD